MGLCHRAWGAAIPFLLIAFFYAQRLGERGPPLEPTGPSSALSPAAPLAPLPRARGARARQRLLGRANSARLLAPSASYGASASYSPSYAPSSPPSYAPSNAVPSYQPSASPSLQPSASYAASLAPSASYAPTASSPGASYAPSTGTFYSPSASYAPSASASYAPSGSYAASAFISASASSVPPAGLATMPSVPSASASPSLPPSDSSTSSSAPLPDAGASQASAPSAPAAPTAPPQATLAPTRSASATATASGSATATATATTLAAGAGMGGGNATATSAPSTSASATATPATSGAATTALAWGLRIVFPASASTGSAARATAALSAPAATPATAFTAVFAAYLALATPVMLQSVGGAALAAAGRARALQDTSLPITFQAAGLPAATSAATLSTLTALLSNGTALSRTLAAPLSVLALASNCSCVLSVQWDGAAVDVSVNTPAGAAVGLSAAPAQVGSGGIAAAVVLPLAALAAAAYCLLQRRRAAANRAKLGGSSRQGAGDGAAGAAGAPAALAGAFSGVNPMSSRRGAAAQQSITPVPVAKAGGWLSIFSSSEKKKPAGLASSSGSGNSSGSGAAEGAARAAGAGEASSFFADNPMGERRGLPGTLLASPLPIIALGAVDGSGDGAAAAAEERGGAERKSLPLSLPEASKAAMFQPQTPATPAEAGPRTSASQSISLNPLATAQEPVSRPVSLAAGLASALVRSGSISAPPLPTSYAPLQQSPEAPSSPQGAAFSPLPLGKSEAAAAAAAVEGAQGVLPAPAAAADESEKPLIADRLQQ